MLDPVANRNIECGFVRMVERHTRWAKMRRAIAPAAFAFEPLLSPTAVGLAAPLVAPSARTVALLVAVMALQLIGAALTARAIRGHAIPWKYLLLEPLRAIAVQVCWLRAALSRRVEWRGHPFTVGKDSVLTPYMSRARRTELA